MKKNGTEQTGKVAIRKGKLQAVGEAYAVTI